MACQKAGPLLGACFLAHTTPNEGFETSSVVGIPADASHRRKRQCSVILRIPPLPIEPASLDFDWVPIRERSEAGLGRTLPEARSDSEKRIPHGRLASAASSDFGSGMPGAYRVSGKRIPHGAARYRRASIWRPASPLTLPQEFAITNAAYRIYPPNPLVICVVISCAFWYTDRRTAGTGRDPRRHDRIPYCGAGSPPAEASRGTRT